MFRSRRRVAQQLDHHARLLAAAVVDIESLAEQNRALAAALKRLHPKQAGFATHDSPEPAADPEPVHAPPAVRKVWEELNHPSG